MPVPRAGFLMRTRIPQIAADFTDEVVLESGPERIDLLAPGRNGGPAEAAPGK